MDSHAWPLLALAAALGWFYRDYLAGTVFLWEDLTTWYYPVANYLAVALAQGRFPFWATELYNGMPFYSEIQTAVYYPCRWVLALFVTDGQLSLVAYQRYHVVHLFFGGVFLYALLQHYRLGRTAGLVGALVFCCSGFTSLHFIFPPLLQVQAWLPLQLLLVEKILVHRRPAHHAALVGVTTLALLASFPQAFLYNSYLVVAFWLYRWWTMPRSTAEPGGRQRLLGLGREGLRAAGVFTAAAWLSAIQWLPALEHWQLSPRSDWDFAQIAQQSLPPAALIRLVIPNFFGAVTGNPEASNFWGYPLNERTLRFGGGPWYYWEFGLYAGQVAVIAAALAVGRLRDRSQSLLRFYVVAGLIGLWFMLGRYGGLFQTAYLLLPGVSWFRGPARMGGLVDFAAAMLVALMVANLRHGARPWLVRTLLGLCTFYAGGLFVVASGWWTPGPALALNNRLAAALTQGVMAVLLLLITGAVLWWRASCVRPWPRRLAGACLALVVSGELTWAFGDFHKGTTDPRHEHADKLGAIARYHELVGAVGPLRFTQRVDLTEPRQLVFYYNTPLFHPGFETPRGYMDLGPAHHDELTQLTNTTVRLDLQNVGLVLNHCTRSNVVQLLTRDSALPRLAFYNNVAACPDDVLIHALDNGTFDYRRVLGVADLPASWPRSATNQPMAGARLNLTRKSPENYRIDYHVETPGVLFISESYYPGWEAVDDRGRQLPIVRAFLAFKGVVLAEPGSGTITLRFRPRVFRLGAAISLAGVLVLGAFAAWRWRRPLP